MAKIDTTNILDGVYREYGRPDVHIGGNSFIYYREGDPTKHLDPDFFVATGVRPRCTPHHRP